MSKKLMSIVVLNWNRLNYSKQTIERLLEKTSVPHELVLVDNNSKCDEIRTYLKSVSGNKYTEDVTCVFNKENFGVGGGRNAGFAIAKGNYLVNIDDDVLVPDDFAEQMMEVCDRVPKIGMSGVCVENIEFPIQIINGVRCRPKNANLGGACVCIPRRVFDVVGYYNCLSLYGHEDCLYYFRLKHLGLISAYIERTGIHLDAGEGKYKEQKDMAQSRNSVQFKALLEYLSVMRATNNVYVGFDTAKNANDKHVFNNDLI